MPSGSFSLMKYQSSSCRSIIRNAPHYKKKYMWPFYMSWFFVTLKNINKILSIPKIPLFFKVSWKKKPAWWFKVTFLGWLSDPFNGLNDLQLGDEKGTLNHLAGGFGWLAACRSADAKACWKNSSRRSLPRRKSWSSQEISPCRSFGLVGFQGMGLFVCFFVCWVKRLLLGENIIITKIYFCHFMG